MGFNELRRVSSLFSRELPKESISMHPSNGNNHDTTANSADDLSDGSGDSLVHGDKAGKILSFTIDKTERNAIMSNDLSFDRFIRTPFQVQAIKITDENIEQVANLIGDVRTMNGKRYISLDRRIIPNIWRAYPGWWVTILGDNIRCYSPKVFREQFMEMPDSQHIAFFFAEDENKPQVVVSGSEDPVEVTGV